MESANCKWNPQIQVECANKIGFYLQFADSTYNLRIPLAIWGSTYKLRIPLAVVDSSTAQCNYTHVLIFVCGFLELFWIPQTQLRIPQVCLFLQRFWAVHRFNYLSVESKTATKIKIATKQPRVPRQIWFWPVVKSVYNIQNAQFGLVMIGATHEKI